MRVLMLIGKHSQLLCASRKSKCANLSTPQQPVQLLISFVAQLEACTEKYTTTGKSY